MDTHIINQQHERKYFSITPQVVMAMVRHPFDLALWMAISSICGEQGKCTVGIRNLVRLTKMSKGQIAESRSYLIEQGLLVGELVKDRYGERWSLSVPDLWQKNAKYRSKIGDDFSARLDVYDQFTKRRKVSRKPASVQSVDGKSNNLTVHSVERGVQSVDIRRTIQEEPKDKPYSPLPPKVEEPAPQAALPFANAKGERSGTAPQDETFGPIQELCDILKNHPRNLTPYKRKFKTRLKSFTFPEIKRAATNCMQSDHMNGKAGKKYATLEYILRNDLNVEKWLDDSASTKEAEDLFNAACSTYTGRGVDRTISVIEYVAAKLRSNPNRDALYDAFKAEHLQKLNTLSPEQLVTVADETKAQKWT